MFLVKNHNKNCSHLHSSATADTCVAMKDWVKNPMARTALDDILPCVDNTTAQETLSESKDVTFQLVNVVNQFITNVSNQDLPPEAGPSVSYNQTGPLVPVLCNPYQPNKTPRDCEAGEVHLSQATQVIKLKQWSEWDKFSFHSRIVSITNFHFLNCISSRYGTITHVKSQRMVYVSLPAVWPPNFIIRWALQWMWVQHSIITGHSLLICRIALSFEQPSPILSTIIVLDWDCLVSGSSLAWFWSHPQYCFLWSSGYHIRDREGMVRNIPDKMQICLLKILWNYRKGWRSSYGVHVLYACWSSWCS